MTEFGLSCILYSMSVSGRVISVYYYLYQLKLIMINLWSTVMEGYEDMLEAHRYHTLMEAARVAEDVDLDLFFDLMEEHCRDPHHANAFRVIKIMLRREPRVFYTNTSTMP